MSTIWLVAYLFASKPPIYSSFPNFESACAEAGADKNNVVLKARIDKRGRILWTRPYVCHRSVTIISEEAK